MTTFANTTPAAEFDGILYAQAVPVTAAEADLANQPSPPAEDPLPVRYNQAFLAVVQLSLSQAVTKNTTYIVAQTDLGDGVWIDLAWIVWNGTSGTATFALAGGAYGAAGLQQSRAAGTAPAANGANALPLGGRLRFVGASSLSTGSSSSSGSSSSGSNLVQVTATIRVKQLGLR